MTARPPILLQLSWWCESPSLWNFLSQKTMASVVAFAKDSEKFPGFLVMIGIAWPTEEPNMWHPHLVPLRWWLLQPWWPSCSMQCRKPHPWLKWKKRHISLVLSALAPNLVFCVFILDFSLALIWDDIGSAIYWCQSYLPRIRGGYGDDNGIGGVVFFPENGIDNFPITIFIHSESLENEFSLGTTVGLIN